MLNSQPLVSIGMPVYNGGKYIRRALDSLLVQSYGNLVLYISDNASTDDTEAICRSYLVKDDRVRYHRNPHNLGVLENWRRVLHLASTEYFMWAAHDDYWSPNYVQSLLASLRAQPQAILAAGKTLYVDVEGNPNLDPDDPPGQEPDGKIARARQLLQQHAHNWLHGLFRREELLRFIDRSLFPADPWGADIVFLFQLCVSREIVGSDAAVMYKRTTGITGPKTPRQRVRWQCWFAWRLLRVIRESALAADEKRALFKMYLRYLKWLYFRRGIVRWAKLWGRAAIQWSIGVDRPSLR